MSAIISCSTLFGEGKHFNGREITVMLTDYERLGCTEDIIARLFEKKNARRRVELEGYGIVEAADPIQQPAPRLTTFVYAVYSRDSARSHHAYGTSNCPFGRNCTASTHRWTPAAPPSIGRSQWQKEDHYYFQE